MRLLVTVNCKWWNAAAQGAAMAALAMKGEGHEVLVQTGRGGITARRLGGMGLPLEEVGQLYPGLRKLAGDFGPDAVVAFRSQGQTAAALTLPEVPLIRYRSDQRRARGGRLWKMVDRRTALVVFPGGSMVRMGYQGPRTGPVQVIPQPVDTQWFAPTERSRERVILSLARLSPVKGHRTLLRAMSAAPDGYTAVIAGGEAQYRRSDLQAVADSLGVGDRVVFAGRVEDVRPLLGRACMGVVTSLGSEAVSRAGMEMMASGVPLLASATNGLLDLVTDGVNGLLHSPGNWRQLAGQMGHLAVNHGLRARLSENGRSHCLRELSMPAVGKRWTKTLEQVCFS